MKLTFVKSVSQYMKKIALQFSTRKNEVLAVFAQDFGKAFARNEVTK